MGAPERKLSFDEVPSTTDGSSVLRPMSSEVEFIEEKPSRPLIVSLLACLPLFLFPLFSATFVSSAVFSLLVSALCFPISFFGKKSSEIFSFQGLRITSSIWNLLAFIAFLSFASIAPVSSMVLVGLLIVQKYLQEYSLFWLTNDCTLLTERMPRTVKALDEYSNFAERELPVEAITAGSIVRFQSDDEVIFDGTVLGGIAEVEEHVPFGVGNQRIKGTGDAVYAGSTIIGGTVDVRVEKLYKDSTYAFFCKVLLRQLSNIPKYFAGQEATLLKTELLILLLTIIGLLVNEVASVGLVGISLTTILLLEFTTALSRVLARHLLLSAYGKGILFSDFGNSLNKINESKTVVFDEVQDQVQKLSTFEFDEFRLIDGRIDVHAVTCILISVLGRSSNAVHLKIAQGLRNTLEKPLSLFEFSEAATEVDSSLPCDAVKAIVDGVVLRIGSEPWLIGQGIQLSPNELVNKKSQFQLVVALNSEAVGILSLHGESEEPFVEAFKSMQMSGWKIALTSFLDNDLLLSIAKKLGLSLESINPNLTEETKINRIASLTPCLLIASMQSTKLVRAASSLVVAPVSALESELPPITLVDEDPRRLFWCIAAVQKYVLLSAIQEKVGFIAAITIPLIAVSIPQSIALTACLPVLVAAYISVYRPR